MAMLAAAIGGSLLESGISAATNVFDVNSQVNNAQSLQTNWINYLNSNRDFAVSQYQNSGLPGYLALGNSGAANAPASMYEAQQVGARVSMPQFPGTLLPYISMAQQQSGMNSLGGGNEAGVSVATQTMNASRSFATQTNTGVPGAYIGFQSAGTIFGNSNTQTPYDYGTASTSVATQASDEAVANMFD